MLIPVFALGRAQELCILLETYWERMQLQYPIYFSLGLTEKANNYYQLFITWTSQKIKKTFVERNMFDFKHIKPFDRSYIEKPGPMVVFATPGMLHAGQSLAIFKKWAPSEQNMIIIPGYCVAGTVGHKVLNGQKKIEVENKQIVRSSHFNSEEIEEFSNEIEFEDRSQTGSRVHVVQCPRRRQRYHAVDSKLRAEECCACAWREFQNGLFKGSNY